MAELKHVGRVKATGKKCLVAFRTLPGDAYNCLIVATENLPDEYHDSIIRLVESSAGQDANEFGEALGRTNFPDGSIMLAKLHVSNRLIKVGTDQIEMTPTPTVTIMLSELNQLIAEQRGIAVDDLSLKSAGQDNTEVQEVGSVSDMPPEQADVSKTTSTSTSGETVQLSAEDQAKKYRSEADRLAKEAAKYRRLAEELVPTKKK